MMRTQRHIHFGETDVRSADFSFFWGSDDQLDKLHSGATNQLKTV